MLPRWMKMLFLVFIGYMVYVGSRVPHEATAPTAGTPVPAITEEKYPTLTNTLDGDRWKRAINPDAVAAAKCGFDAAATTKQLGLKVIDEALGDGAGAACGDAITAHITVWSAAGGAAHRGETPLTLGDGALAYGIDAGLVGIRVGGTRTLVLSPAALKRGKNSTADAALRNALPTNTLAVVTIRRIK